MKLKEGKQATSKKSVKGAKFRSREIMNDAFQTIKNKNHYIIHTFHQTFHTLAIQSFKEPKFQILLQARRLELRIPCRSTQGMTVCSSRLSRATP